MIKKVKNNTLKTLSIPALNLIVCPGEVIEVDSSVLPIEGFSVIEDKVEEKTKTNKSKK